MTPFGQLLQSGIMILLIRSVDTADPDNQNLIFSLFTATHMVLLVVAFYLYHRVGVVADDTPIKVPLPQGMGESKITYEDTTIESHDRSFLHKTFLLKVAMPVAISIFVYNKWQVIIPFMVQSVHNPMTVYKSEVFQVHILGREAKDKLARPWVEENPFKKWTDAVGGGVDPAKGKKAKRS